MGAWRATPYASATAGSTTCGRRDVLASRQGFGELSQPLLVQLDAAEDEGHRTAAGDGVEPRGHARRAGQHEVGGALSDAQLLANIHLRTLWPAAGAALPRRGSALAQIPESLTRARGA